MRHTCRPLLLLHAAARCFDRVHDTQLPRKCRLTSSAQASAVKTGDHGSLHCASTGTFQNATYLYRPKVQACEHTMMTQAHHHYCSMTSTRCAIPEPFAALLTPHLESMPDDQCWVSQQCQLQPECLQAAILIPCLSQGKVAYRQMRDNRAVLPSSSRVPC